MSVLVYPPVVPPGHSPPLAVVTDTDHRAWIYITASLGLSMTLLSSVIRIFIRYGSKSGWGLDDASLAVATVFSFLQTAIVLAAGSYGLGSSTLVTSRGALERAQKIYYASNLLYLLALGASRQSVVLFLRRVTPVRAHRKVLNTMLGAEAAWTVAFFMAIALQCNLTHPWLLGQNCANGWFTRWEAIEITGAIFEVIIFVVAIWMLVWHLQVSYDKKAIIVVAFGLRLLTLVIIVGFHLASFDKRGFMSDPTLSETGFICWTQAEMNLSIITATIPIAHRFLASLVTYYGGAGGRNLSQSEYTPHDTSPSYTAGVMKTGTMRSNKSEKTHRSASMRIPSIPEGALAKDVYISGARDAYRYSVGVEHGDRRPPGEITAPARNDSERLIIRKDVTYEVEYDT